MRQRKFKVRCPASAYAVYDMCLYFTAIDGKPFPLPCNGCDSSNGSETCQKCMADITLMFFHDPDLRTTEPLVPRPTES